MLPSIRAGVRAEPALLALPRDRQARLEPFRGNVAGFGGLRQFARSGQLDLAVPNTLTRSGVVRLPGRLSRRSIAITPPPPLLKSCCRRAENPELRLKLSLLSQSLGTDLAAQAGPQPEIRLGTDASGCLVYQTDSGRVLTLNPAADLILSYCDGTATVRGIYSEITAEIPMTRAISCRALRSERNR